MRSLIIASVISLVFQFCFWSCGEKNNIPFELMSLFSDHMVLQQNSTVPVWGKYTPGQMISIKSGWGQEVTGKADQQGLWKLSLDSPEAGGPYDLSVITEDSTVVIEDILIGEVWLASGQSNMQMPLKGWPPNDPIKNSKKEIENANYPEIRMFTVDRRFAKSPLEDVNGNWQVCSPSTAGDFSATGYFFARSLHQELNVPIGIIHSSWGGTVAEAWTDKTNLKDLGDFDEVLATIDDPTRQEVIDQWFDRWPSIPTPPPQNDWKDIALNDLQLASPSGSDYNWGKRVLPGRIDNFEGIELDGAIWVRKEFKIEELIGEYSLAIGAIDDRDEVFVNGQLVGSTMNPGQYNVPRNYAIPQGILKAGGNLLAIRIVDTGGPGAIQGPIQLEDGDDQIMDLSGEWDIRPTAEFYDGKIFLYNSPAIEISERPTIYQLNQNSPSALYNAMIHPLVPYSIKGAIWYQGESNVGRAKQYDRLFPKMISNWRESWGYTFPFYFTQIAPFAYNGNSDRSNDQSQKLRDAQRKSLSLEQTGMAVTLDIGNNFNIHPANKQDVGKRLALWALANDYGVSIIPSGPLYKGHEVSSNTVIIQFDFTGNGLQSDEDGLSEFEISGKAGIFYAAKAKIINDEVHVSSDQVKDPMNVRYAWQDKAKASLFNSAGLPASSFTTER